MEVCEIKKMIIMNTCNYLNYVLLWCRMRAAHFVGCVIFPSNEYNDGHPCLWQWLLVVLVQMSFSQEIVRLYLWRWFMRASSCLSDYCLVFVLMSTTHLMTLVAYNFPFSSILMFIRQVVLQPVAKW
jgi:hypothetical protein